MRLKRRKPTPPHTHEARIGGRTVPKELVKCLAEPSIHRPQKWCPLMEVSRTSGVERKYGCSAEAPLQHIGLSPPLQAPNSRRVPGNALARVDVPNRYLGNKACKYETKEPAEASRVAESIGILDAPLKGNDHRGVLGLRLSRRGI